MPSYSTWLARQARAPMPSGFDYFRKHYDTYTVAAPSAPGGKWQAAALSDHHGQLFGWSDTELLGELAEHCSRNHMGK
jgi:hypothetical protein